MGPIQYLAAIVAYTAAMTIASVLPHDYSPRGDNGPHLNCGKTDLPPLGNDQPVFDLIARYCRSYRAHSTHWGNYVDPNSYDAVSCFASDKSALTYFSINIDKPENQPDSILPNESQCNVMFRDAYMTCKKTGGFAFSGVHGKASGFRITVDAGYHEICTPPIVTEWL